MENQRIVSDEQIEINRINASKSTGPRTEEGKRNSRMNALRHGITASLLALNAEERARYDIFVAGFTERLQPVGALELSYAQAAAGQSWRLQRAQNVDHTLFLLADADLSEIPGLDPATAASLSQTIAFAANSAEFQRLTIYEMRIQRSMERSLKALNELQTERKAAHAEALGQAKGLARLAHRQGLPYEPATDAKPTDRFVFSSDEIHAALRFDDRLVDLKHYRDCGWDSKYRFRVAPPPIVELPAAA